MMKSFKILCLLLVISLVPKSMQASEVQGFGLLHHGGTLNKNIELISFAPGDGSVSISLWGPQKAFEVLKATVTGTASTFVDGKIATIRDGVTVKISYPNAFVLLGSSKQRVVYTSAEDPEKQFYFDGSVGSYQFLLRQIVRSTYKDPFQTKYYNLAATRPNKTFISCKTDLGCFQKAARTCALATWDSGMPPFLPSEFSRVEIWGKDKTNRCLIYTKYLKTVVEGEAVDDLYRRGLDGLCTQQTAELARKYKNLQDGIITFDDEKTSICHGLLYGKP
ncbi:hypothetical protein EXS71_00740 [Candidatus Uhrbacteria bacterium]|nr:hypothetical protein [Candidatus Uhrbacteria bacterium]